MKKSNCILGICVIGGILGSVIILLVAFDYSPCRLFEDFLGAVFTGCLFAVPSGLLIVNEDIKRIRNEQAVLLSDLSDYFKNVFIKGYGDYNPEVIEGIRSNIVEIYKLIGRELNENYLKKKEKRKVEELLNKIFDFSCIILDLNKKYKKISKENFDKDVEHIYELKDSCCKLIQEVQENKY
ncbi:MAG: hypothetical protein HDR08_11145 [Lachnospiraceae bacterium]|nr:hypothetical protein [Lachnospiraceae bacterium]